MSDLAARAPLVFVDSVLDDRKPGQAKYWQGVGDYANWRGLNFVCPGCGKLGSIRFTDPGAPSGWTWDEATLTARPSILHDQKSCGWHGYLTNGVFEPC